VIIKRGKSILLTIDEKFKRAIGTLFFRYSEINSAKTKKA
jgi:hypothetical protein